MHSMLNHVTFTFVGGLGGLEILIILMFPLFTLILWVWALVDLLRSSFADQTNKLIWTLVIIFLPLLGALLYFWIGQEQKLSDSA